SVSPPGAKGAEVTHVTLPAKSEVHFAEQSLAIYTQQIIVVAGELTFDTGHKQVVLKAGDWFQTPETGTRTFINARAKQCQYLLVVT
ncbi:MAG: cupin domain-containing protein, partial [Pseudomonadota bacterium]